MKIVGIMPARNEDWIIGMTLRALLMWVDAVVVLLHACTDNTESIVKEVSGEHPGKVKMVYDSDPKWEEMYHRQGLLEEARELDCTHVAYVDADEMLSGNLLPIIRKETEKLSPARYLELFWACMWKSRYRYPLGKGSIWGRSYVTTITADDGNISWKPTSDGYHFHHRNPYDSNRGIRIDASQGALMHFQHVNWDRLRAKQALYKMIEATQYPNHEGRQSMDAKYSRALSEEGCVFEVAPDSWWEPYEHLAPFFHPTKEPWQKRECGRLWNAHSPRTFIGLDLFGVVGK